MNSAGRRDSARGHTTKADRSVGRIAARAQRAENRLSYRKNSGAGPATEAGRYVGRIAAQAGAGRATEAGRYVGRIAQTGVTLRGGIRLKPIVMSEE